MAEQYVPGTCNIGPEEIALRRRAGHAAWPSPPPWPPSCSAPTSIRPGA